MVDRKVVNFALWTCMVMLVLAPLSGWPYGYYTLLRWVVCLTTGYLAYENYRNGQRSFSLAFGAVALILNPIVPVHLSKSEWGPIDLAVAGFLFFYIVRGKSIRLRLEKNLRKKLVLWGGGGLVCFLLLWGVWPSYRYESYDYPISLISERAKFRPEENLKSIKGELVIHGWNVKPVSGSPNTYLVSYTYTHSVKNPFGDTLPQPQRGWWWEVKTRVPLVRSVSNDPELAERYGITFQAFRVLPSTVTQ